MINSTSPQASIIPVPHRQQFSDWRTDLTLSRRSRLLKSVNQVTRHFYLNRSHEQSNILTEGATITLRSKKFTYSWMVKGFTPTNTFEITKADNPAWALSFRINEKGFCLDSDPARSEFPLMILEHAEGCYRGELNTFNKEISDPYLHIYGTAGWDHRQLKWYWQTRPPKEFAYKLICSDLINSILENEEVILFTIDSYTSFSDTYRISLYRPFDMKTIEVNLNSGSIHEIAVMDYPDKDISSKLGATGS